MPLSSGSVLGPYQILTALGAGGMGEVFRARDTKLNRFVAIKVLPDLFAPDPERLARFRREAQALAVDAQSRDLAITPDGRRIIHKGTSDNNVQFYVRTMDALDVVPPARPGRNAHLSSRLTVRP